MAERRKWIIIGLLAGLLIALALLAGSLPALHLLPGQPYRLPAGEEDVLSQLAASDLPTKGFIWLRGILAIALIIYPIYILISLLTKHGRQRLINDLIRLGVLALFLYMINKRGVLILERLGAGVAGSPLSLADVPESVPLAVFNSSAPGWAPLALLTAGALLLLAFLGAIAWWWFMPTRHSGISADRARQELVGEAGQAVAEIDGGAEVQDVVLRAYYRMERILLEERKLARPEAMTTSEFAGALNAEGLPAGAVNDLTHLFEAVRYGEQKLSPEQQQRAVRALKAIALADG